MIITLTWILLHKDIIIAVIGIIATIWGKLSPSLPLKYRILLRKLGGRKVIIALINEAQEFCGTMGSTKRAYVVSEMQLLSQQKLGFEIPTAVCNLILEFIYDGLEKIENDNYS